MAPQYGFTRMTSFFSHESEATHRSEERGVYILGAVNIDRVKTKSQGIWWRGYGILRSLSSPASKN